MGIYNGVWEHLIRRFITRPPISSERSQLLPSNDDVSIYESTANIPSGATSMLHQFRILLIHKQIYFSLYLCISIVIFKHFLFKKLNFYFFVIIKKVKIKIKLD